jgi:glyoxylase-like metal-dependent hydrolase (beta-lactamase superfamily II)
MLVERVIAGSLEANGYILYQRDGGGALIIDPGYTAARYTDFVKEHGLTVYAILLTHTHPDHAGKAAALADTFGCPVEAQREELDYYKGRVDHVLEGGEIFDLDGEEIRVLHTPGHTAGGVCYYSEKSRVAFTGDTVFNVDLGYTHFPGGDAARMRKSLREVIDQWGNDVTIYPGHGDSATMRYVRTANAEFREMVAG